MLRLFITFYKASQSNANLGLSTDLWGKIIFLKQVFAYLGCFFQYFLGSQILPAAVKSVTNS